MINVFAFIQSDVLVHIESTAEDRGSELPSSNSILVVRVKEQSYLLTALQSNHISATSHGEQNIILQCYKNLNIYKALCSSKRSGGITHQQSETLSLHSYMQIRCRCSNYQNTLTRMSAASLFDSWMIVIELLVYR